MSIVDSLLNAPLPNLLIVLGAFFFLLAIVSEITDTPLGSLTADGYGRVIAVAIGPVFLVLGVLVLLATTPVAPPSDGGALADGTGAALTPPAASTTPAERVTPVDQSLAETTPAQTTPVVTDRGVVFEREPNDAAVSATLVESGATVSGEIRSTSDPDPSMDSDYLAVWVDAGDPIAVDVSREAGAGTVYVVLLDPNGLSKPSGNWLSDVVPVQGGERIRVEAVARQSGYHYVLVSGWIYLIDLDLYFNDGGNGAYTVELGPSGGQASADRVADASRLASVHEPVRRAVA